jgi:hypothetical protein
MSTLRGRFPSIALPDVLQLIQANRKTGELLISRGDRSGVMFILRGEVIHAQVGANQGERAAFEILEWEEGDFEFVPTPVHAERTIRRGVPDLLIEAARTSDSRKHLSGIFPDPTAVPWLLPGQGALPALMEEAKAVLPYLDGFHTMPEVIAGSGLGDVAALEVCSALRNAGRLELLSPYISVVAAPAKVGFLQGAGAGSKLFRVNEAHWQAMQGPWGRSRQPCTLAKAHEANWQRMGPYAKRAIEQVHLHLPQEPVVVPVQFVKGAEEGVFGMPKELMQALGLAEGSALSIRPAP